MYAVAVKRDFKAQHYLIGGNWGEENVLHTHHYCVELQLRGRELDRYGYLTDIAEIESLLDARVHYYQDRTLNDLPEFSGLNPSIERFAFVLCKAFVDTIKATTVHIVTAKVWESDIAWASYTYITPGTAQDILPEL